MLSFLIKSFIKAVVTLFVVVTVVFFATRLSGNAIDFIAGDGLDAQSRAELITYYGLREDMATQYWRYLRGIAGGEFGISLIERRPVTTIFFERLGPTLKLVGGAILVTLALAIPAGIYAAVRRKQAAAKAMMTLAFVGYATPNFVLATVLLLIFSYWLQLLPSAGNSTWAHYLMPVGALSMMYLAALMRYTRNATLDVLGQDYLRTARAKGLSGREVIVCHALRNTLITVLSVVGLMVTGLVSSGAVVIESIFSWRGIGDLLVNAAIRRDYPVLQFGVLAVAVAVVVINTLVDMAYAFVDPPSAPGGADFMNTSTAAQAMPQSWLAALWKDADMLVRFALIAGLVLVGATLLAPWLSPFGPDQQSLLSRLRPPYGFEGAVAGHWLGTDELGRDILSRVLHALRVTLGIGLAGAFIGMMLGTALGILAGLRGGRLDDLIAGAIDIQIAVPFTLIALLAVAILGGDLVVLIAVLGVAGWETFARVVRGEVMKLRHQPFIEAAHVAGASRWRIAFRHLLPSLVSPLVVMFALSFSQIVLLESTLSFLGLGIRPPTASLGSMIGQGRDYMPSAPWLVIVPSLLILLLTLVVQLLGDFLRDRADIRLQHR